MRDYSDSERLDRQMAADQRRDAGCLAAMSAVFVAPVAGGLLGLAGLLLAQTVGGGWMPDDGLATPIQAGALVAGVLALCTLAFAYTAMRIFGRHSLVSLLVMPLAVGGMLAFAVGYIAAFG